MAELTIGQLVKIILGLIVVIAVVFGVFLFFRNNVIGFFGGLPQFEGEFDGCSVRDVDPPTGAYFYEDRESEGIYYFEKMEEGWYSKSGRNKDEVDGIVNLVLEEGELEFIEAWKTCEGNEENQILESGIK